MQLGGGVTTDNALEYLDAGASHVIVTSYVFREGRLEEDRLKALVGGRHATAVCCKHQGFICPTSLQVFFMSARCCNDTTQLASGIAVCLQPACHTHTGTAVY